MYEKIASDILGDVISHVNTLYSHEKKAGLMPTADEWVALAKYVGLPAVGLGGSYAIGRATQGANNEYDKMKYGLGGAALGLAAPVILSNLTGGKSNLGSLLNSIASPTGTNPDHQDFTSI